MQEVDDKMIHDMNSGISAIEQSLEIIFDNKDNAELTEKMLPLCIEKIKEVNASWNKIKKHLK